MALRPALVWALVGTAVLSAVALWWPQQPPPALVAVTQRVEGRSRALDQAMHPADPTPQAAGRAGPLPREWPQADWLSLKGNPFGPATPQAPAAVAPPSQPASAALPTEPPKPPELNLRFLGRFVQPDGQVLVYLARGNQSLLVRAGDRLDEGYLVESIDTQAVVLSHPLERAPRVLPLPADEAATPKSVKTDP